MNKLGLKKSFLLLIAVLLVGGFLVAKTAVAVEEGDPIVPEITTPEVIEVIPEITIPEVIPESDPVVLTVNVTVTGEGSVLSSPAGIDCDDEDSPCSADFTSDVTLTAEGYDGHEFYGWPSGVCDSSDEYTCTINLGESSHTVNLSLDFGVPPPVVGPWYVNAATGNDANDCVSATIGVPPVGPCKTIQAAINKASAGDTVNVALGVYPEHVTVNKALTLNGANSGLNCLAARGTESVITGAASGGVQILANNVTFNGFQVSSGNNALGSGIWMDATKMGSLIKNNLISQSQEGIYANNADSSEIRCNVFDGNNEPGSAGGAGIYSEYTSNLTIDNNEFKNHLTNNPVIFGATGPGVHSGLIFSNNLVHDNYSGLYVLGVDIGQFIGNDISATDATALSFAGGNFNVEVSGNKIHDSARGVRFENGGYPGLGTDDDFEVTLNSFTGNTDYGVGNISTGHTAPVNATCNWWGAADGPGPVGPGTGDKVTTDVDFATWLTSDDLSDCIDEPEDSGSGHHHGSHSGGSSNSGVQESNSASTGGQVLGAEKFIFTLFLKKGPPYHFSTWGNEVMELQKLLNSLGYNCGPVDGKFGVKTDACVRAFQAAHPPLKVDGIVGPLTRAVLNSL